jgi:hypothetical protein
MEDTMSETPDTTGEKSQIDLIEEFLMNVEFIERVSFKAEGPVEMSPNVLTITPEYGVSELRLRLLGCTVTKLIQAIHPQYEIKGRLTHQLTDKTNEYGDMIGFKPILHLPRIKISWFGHRWDRTPDKTRFDSDTAFEVSSDETIENQDEFIEKIAAIEMIELTEDEDGQPALATGEDKPDDTDIIDI